MTIYHWIGLAGVAWACVWGGFGAYIASQKGRPEGEGMVFGALLGPIGLLIVAILPAVQKAETPAAPAAPVPTYRFTPRRMLGPIDEPRN